jgi:hypothetical protein
MRVGMQDFVRLDNFEETTEEDEENADFIQYCKLNKIYTKIGRKRYMNEIIMPNVFKIDVYVLPDLACWSSTRYNIPINCRVS